MKMQLATCLIVAMLAADPALACPGQQSEHYLMWSSLPDLLDGEVAVEVDVRDALIAPERRKADGSRIFNVTRVLAGDLGGAPTIAVVLQSGSCTRNTVAAIIGEKVFVDRIILVGRVDSQAGDDFRLIPRYMSFEDMEQFGAAAVVDE